MRIVDLRDILPRSPTQRWGTRERPIDTLVVHHTATPASTTPAAIARYHVEQRGYPGIAYHYGIRPDGRVERYNDDARLTWHGNGANGTGIGVALFGDFTTAQPNIAQLAALGELYWHLCERYGVLKLIGHRQAPGAATECPGRAFTEEMLNMIVTSNPRAAITDVRWQCEEAVRELDAALQTLEEAAGAVRLAKARLLNNAIPQLYRLEGVNVP